MERIQRLQHGEGITEKMDNGKQCQWSHQQLTIMEQEKWNARLEDKQKNNRGTANDSGKSSTSCSNG